MAPLLTLRPRERRLALAAGVLIGCWLFLSWIMQPLWERFRDLRLEAQTKTEKLEAISRLLAKAGSIKQTYQQVAPYLGSSTTDERAGATLLNELETLSRTSDVQLSLKPHQPKDEERMNRFDVELDVEGSQQNLLEFLDALFRLPKLIAIERLRISVIPAKTDALRAHLLLNTYTPQQPDRPSRP